MFFVVQFLNLDMLVPCYFEILICIHHIHVLIMMHVVYKSAKFSVLILMDSNPYVLIMLSIVCKSPQFFALISKSFLRL